MGGKKQLGHKWQWRRAVILIEAKLRYWDAKVRRRRKREKRKSFCDSFWNFFFARTRPVFPRRVALQTPSLAFAITNHTLKHLLPLEKHCPIQKHCTTKAVTTVFFSPSSTAHNKHTNSSDFALVCRRRSIEENFPWKAPNVQ